MFQRSFQPTLVLCSLWHENLSISWKTGESCFPWRCHSVIWLSQGCECLQKMAAPSLLQHILPVSSPTHTGPARASSGRGTVKGRAADEDPNDDVWSVRTWQGGSVSVHCSVIHPSTWTQPAVTIHVRGADCPAAMASRSLCSFLRRGQGPRKTHLAEVVGTEHCWQTGADLPAESLNREGSKRHTWFHMPLAFLGLTWSPKLAGKKSWGDKLLQK